MKEIIMFYMNGCPYCANAKKAIEELRAQNPAFEAVSVNMVNENQHPEIAEQYDYYYVPTMIFDGKKVYEAHPGESYEACREEVRKVFEAAVR